jgi:hypothetical protein
MAKRKIPKLTPEDHARHEEHQRMVRERIAYHEAKAREEEERRAAKARSPWGRLMRLLGRTP